MLDLPRRVQLLEQRVKELEAINHQQNATITMMLDLHEKAMYREISPSYIPSNPKIHLLQWS